MVKDIQIRMLMKLTNQKELLKTAAAKAGKVELRKLRLHMVRFELMVPIRSDKKDWKYAYFRSN